MCHFQYIKQPVCQWSGMHGAGALPPCYVDENPFFWALISPEERAFTGVRTIRGAIVLSSKNGWSPQDMS